MKRLLSRKLIKDCKSKYNWNAQVGPQRPTTGMALLALSVKTQHIDIITPQEEQPTTEIDSLVADSKFEGSDRRPRIKICHWVYGVEICLSTHLTKVEITETPS